MSELQAVEVEGALWHVPTGSTNVSFIGGGAFGVVASACTPDGSILAVKRFISPFNTVHTAKRVYRECRLLRIIAEDVASGPMEHKNIISLIGIKTPDISLDTFHNVYTLMERTPTSLQSVTQGRMLDDSVIRLITFQLLRGLKYLHSAGVTHRDLKPENIGYYPNHSIRIFDIGLAKSKDEEEDEQFFTSYAVTKHYRAPEIILRRRYGPNSDMWSLACIVAEMCEGHVLLPGDHDFAVMELIVERFGFPTDPFMIHVSSTIQQAMEGLRPRAYVVPIRDIVPHASDDAVVLLEAIFTYDTDARPSASDALELNFVSELHDPAIEPVAAHSLVFFDYKRLLFEELRDYRSHCPLQQDAFHSFQVNETTWNVPSRYTNPCLIGGGGFGQVALVHDSVLGTEVAIKRILDPFRSIQHAKRSFREVRLLRLVNEDVDPDTNDRRCVEMVKMIDAFSSESTLEQFNSVYIVMEAITGTLHTIIRSVVLGDPQVAYITYQLLRGLKYMHSCGIIHRDLKPSNIGICIIMERIVLTTIYRCVSRLHHPHSRFRPCSLAE